MLESFALEKLSEGPRSLLPPNLVQSMRSDLLVEDRQLRVLVLVRCMPLYRVEDPGHFLRASISLLNGQYFMASFLDPRSLGINSHLRFT